MSPKCARVSHNARPHVVEQSGQCARALNLQEGHAYLGEQPGPVVEGHGLGHLRPVAGGKVPGSLNLLLSPGNQGKIHQLV